MPPNGELPEHPIHTSATDLQTLGNFCRTPTSSLSHFTLSGSTVGLRPL